MSFRAFVTWSICTFASPFLHHSAPYLNALQYLCSSNRNPSNTSNLPSLCLYVTCIIHPPIHPSIHLFILIAAQSIHHSVYVFFCLTNTPFILSIFSLFYPYLSFHQCYSTWGCLSTFLSVSILLSIYPPLLIFETVSVNLLIQSAFITTITTSIYSTVSLILNAIAHCLFRPRFLSCLEFFFFFVPWLVLSSLFTYQYNRRYISSLSECLFNHSYVSCILVWKSAFILPALCAS